MKIEEVIKTLKRLKSQLEDQEIILFAGRAEDDDRQSAREIRHKIMALIRAIIIIEDI